MHNNKLLYNYGTKVVDVLFLDLNLNPTLTIKSGNVGINVNNPFLGKVGPHI